MQPPQTHKVGTIMNKAERHVCDMDCNEQTVLSATDSIHSAHSCIAQTNSFVRGTLNTFCTLLVIAFTTKYDRELLIAHTPPSLGVAPQLVARIVFQT